MKNKIRIKSKYNNREKILSYLATGNSLWHSVHMYLPSHNKPDIVWNNHIIFLVYTGNYYMAQADLKLLILLPQPLGIVKSE